MKWTLCEGSEIPTVVVTAKGEVQTFEEAQIYVHDLGLFVTAQLLDATLAVLLLGKTLRRPRIYLRVGQRSKTTVDQGREDNCIQNGQFCTSCCSRAVRQFWKQSVFNIDIAGFVVTRSSSRAK